MYEDLRHYALHRFQQAEVLEAAAVTDPDFDLDAYIETGTFARRQSGQQVLLVADIHPQVAWLLNETPLSHKQQIQPIPEGETAPKDWQRLTAEMGLDKETLWWIYGMNNQIHLHAPQQWVDEIKTTLAGLQDFYDRT